MIPLCTPAACQCSAPILGLPCQSAKSRKQVYRQQTSTFPPVIFRFLIVQFKQAFSHVVSAVLSSILLIVSLVIWSVVNGQTIFEFIGGATPETWSALAVAFALSWLALNFTTAARMLWSNSRVLLIDLDIQKPPIYRFAHSLSNLLHVILCQICTNTRACSRTKASSNPQSTAATEHSRQRNAGPHRRPT